MQFYTNRVGDDICRYFANTDSRIQIHGPGDRDVWDCVYFLRINDPILIEKYKVELSQKNAVFKLIIKYKNREAGE